MDGLKLAQNIIITAAILGFEAMAQDSDAPKPIFYEAAVTATAGSGRFAPFLMSANRYGTITSSDNILMSAAIGREIDPDRRFSYGFGLKLYGGLSSSVSYERYSSQDDLWYMHDERPSSFWIQSLYGEVKWRSIYLSFGMKEKGSMLLDNRLSSGDMTRSANARPIPELSGGLVDFRDIPLTRGWLQVEGELSYGKFTDPQWWRNHADYYNSKIVSGIWYTYRRLYLRTKPDMPLSVTFGLQSTALFGGETQYYYKGQLVKTDKRGIKFADFFKIIVPADAGDTEDFAMGNTLGSYDFKATYRFKRGSRLSAYFEWPWEDGSGLAKRNGFDGLYGVEYRSSEGKAIEAALIEYLDLTNQSGPIHWAPGDHPGTGLTGQATGADDYYNNAYYQSYANYGIGMGNAMVMSPIYNQDGYMAFVGTRMRGVNVAAAGMLSRSVGWEAKVGWRKAYGSGYVALLPSRKAWSVSAGGSWRCGGVPGLSLDFSIAFDRGDLPGNAFGCLAGITYGGNLSFSRN